jgi:hypothetical protein
MVRMGPATPDELRVAFAECLTDALRGEAPPTETGLGNDTLDALWAVAEAAYDGQPTDAVVVAARAGSWDPGAHQRHCDGGIPRLSHISSQ